MSDPGQPVLDMVSLTTDIKSIFRANVISIDQQDSEVIRRNPSNSTYSKLNYLESIIEKTSELENYYKEREVIYKEIAQQEEIVLQPVPISEGETPELDGPAENLFYFAPESQINREIRKLEDAMEAKERHSRAKATREKSGTTIAIRTPINLRKYAVTQKKKSTSTPRTDQLALPQTTLSPMKIPASQENLEQPKIDQKKKISVRTQTSQKTKAPRPKAPKEKKTVEEMMMAHLQSIPAIQPNLTRPKNPGKTILLAKPLSSSAPKTGRKRRGPTSNSESAKKSKTPEKTLEKTSHLNDHGVFDQFGKSSDCSVQVSEIEPTNENTSTPVHTPLSPSQHGAPNVKDKPTTNDAKTNHIIASDYLDDFDDSDCEMDHDSASSKTNSIENQNDSLLTSANISPGTPIVPSPPDPIRPSRPVSTDSGKDSDETTTSPRPVSFIFPSRALSSPIQALHEPEVVTSTKTYMPSLETNIQALQQYALFDDEDSDNAVESIESDNDVVFVDEHNKFSTQDVIMIEDSDNEEIISGPDLEFISRQTKDIANIDEITIGEWLDAERLPLGFKFAVGQKIRYGEYIISVEPI